MQDDPMATALPARDDLTQAPDATARRSRAWALALTLALIVLGLAWELWLAPTGARTLALKVLPLAALVAGLSRLRLRSYRWMSMLVWLYAGEGALRWLSDRGPMAAITRPLAAVELLLSLALFAACVWHIRHRLAPVVAESRAAKQRARAAARP